MNKDESTTLNHIKSTSFWLSDHVNGDCEETTDTDNVAKNIYLSNNNINKDPTFSNKSAEDLICSNKSAKDPICSDKSIKDPICSDNSAKIPIGYNKSASLSCQTNQNTDSVRDIISLGNCEEHGELGGENPLVIPQASKSHDIMRSISNLENDLFLLHSLYKNKWSTDKNLAEDLLTKQRIQKRVKSLNKNRSAIANKTAYSPRKPKKKTTEREDVLLCKLPPLPPNRNLIKRCLSSPPGKLNSQDEVGKSREKVTNNKGGDNSLSFLPPLTTAKKETPQRRKVVTPYPRQAIFGRRKMWGYEKPTVDSDISEKELRRLQKLQIASKQKSNYPNSESDKFDINPDSHRNEATLANNFYKNNTYPKPQSWTIPFKITKDDYKSEQRNVHKITPGKFKASKIPSPAWKVYHSSKRKDPWEQQPQTKGRVQGCFPVATERKELCKQRIEQKYLQPMQYLPVQINKPINQFVSPHYHPMHKSRIPTRLPALNDKYFTTLENRREFAELTKGSKIPVLKPIQNQQQTIASNNDNTHLPVSTTDESSPTLSYRSYSSISDTVSTNISLTDEDSPTTCPSSPVKCFHKDDVKNQMKLNLIKAVHKELIKNKQSEFKRENAWQIEEHREKIYGKSLNSPKDVLISTKFRQIYPQDRAAGTPDDENSSCPHVLSDCVISDNFDDVNINM